MSSSESDNESWEDWGEEGDSVQNKTLCLFCNEVCPSTDLALEHCKSAHNFDLELQRKVWSLDFYSTIKLINYIRTYDKKETDEKIWTKIKFFSDITPSSFSDDKFLKPTIEDDPLLFSLSDNDQFENDSDDESGGQEGSSSIPSLYDNLTIEQLKERLFIAEKRASIAEQRCEELAQALTESRDLLNRTFESDQKLKIESDSDSDNDSPREVNGSKYYFDSYSHYGIHLEMLHDKVRTEGYQDSMYLHKDLFKDKIILDIGCGTGILSMFAAKSGAKMVIGIDNSDIIENAQKIVKLNHLEDVITLIKGKVEQVTLPIEKVDIIVSEWMGYFLLFESMLDTVLFARDKWLDKNGKLFPHNATLILTAIDDEEYFEDNVQFWDQVYGFNMSVMKPHTLSEPMVCVVPPKFIISDSYKVLDIDISTATKQSLDFSSNFCLNITTDSTTCHAIVGYFDVAFPTFNQDKKPEAFEPGQGFSTSPTETPTHWKQTVFFLETPLRNLMKGDCLKGNINVSRNKRNFRNLDIFIEYWVESPEKNIKIEKKSQGYFLG
eukprot:TRINITY_DN6568_c0_g1_i2.p1 TRINITY_DN6568_c0_g1~~TRINITY_DN6568_c0_g1_i2.p1  ORF type:complete len:590 (-),score=126.34 TRINITY_DN6568_c0_g1_i2:79-1731(-)